MSKDKFQTLKEFYESEPSKSYVKRIQEANPEVLKSFRRHAMEGSHTGHFVKAALRNDLQGTVGRADDYMKNCIREVVLYLCNPYPVGAWGSKEIVENWRDQGGLVGTHGKEKALKIAQDSKF